MSLNPANNASNTDWKDKNTIGAEGATVTQTKAHTQGDDVGHTVFVRPDTMERDIPADVGVSQTGDVKIPTEGSRVIIAYRVNERPTVLTQRYSASDDLPAFEPGERVIGHPLSDSHIRLAKDGSITVKGDRGNTIELASDGSVSLTNDSNNTVELSSDGSVTINGGSANPVTDVTTSTDADGHVTSISLTRSSNIYIP